MTSDQSTNALASCCGGTSLTSSFKIKALESMTIVQLFASLFVYYM